jgi:hypothetical protein
MTNGVSMNQTPKKYIHTPKKIHTTIVNKCDFSQRQLIGAWISSTTTLLQSGEPGESNMLLDTSDRDGKNDDNPKQHKIKTYPTMLKLIPATATSSLRAPSELPESFQRAFSSWANYSSLELLVKTPICHLLFCRHYFHWQVSLFDLLLVLSFLHFCKCWKVFLMFCIDKFNKTCSHFICTVEQFDVFLVCVFSFEQSLLLLQFCQSWNY